MELLLAPLKSYAIHVITPSICDDCDDYILPHGHFERINLSDVEIREIAPHELERLARQHGSPTAVERRCPSCDKNYLAVHRVIPVHAQSFACPRCGTIEQLVLQIQKLTRGEERFRLLAALKCSKCGHARTFTRQIDRFLSVTRIEIDELGISAKRGIRAVAAG